MMISAVFFGAITGTLTAVTVLLYKLCAAHVIDLSDKAYKMLRLRPLLIPVALIVLLVLAFLYTLIYRKHPNLGGGGIPTSIGILRGRLPFRWISNLIGKDDDKNNSEKNNKTDHCGLVAHKALTCVT